MRQSRGIHRVYSLIIWSAIIILGMSIILDGLKIMKVKEGTYSNNAEDTPISKIINRISVNSMPILKLVETNVTKNNIIGDYLSELFPIVEYANNYDIASDYEYVEGLDDKAEAYTPYIKNSKYNLLFLQQDRNRLNNNYYVSMILRGIEENRYSNNMEYLAEVENRGIYLGKGGGSKTLSSNSIQNMLSIEIMKGDVFMEEMDYHSDASMDIAQTISTSRGETFTLSKLKDLTYLYNNFYILSNHASIDNSVFDVDFMVNKDFSIHSTNKKPQILVYHTHSQETFIDSKEGKVEDSIVGVGAYLSKILTEQYGYNVIHDTSTYDMMEGYVERNLAYDHASDGISKILKENPSIEVIIDVHRDGNDKGIKRVTKIAGKDTAQIMLLNGLSRNKTDNITRLYNEYQKENLAFSLQLQLKGRELLPGLMFKNYLNVYRYNLHYRERSILAEVGTNYNTVSEAMNSMEYLSVILDQVLKGK